ncbi:MAG: hypothetical protein RL764_1702 [Pseudomonadota bacterium]
MRLTLASLLALTATPVFAQSTADPHGDHGGDPELVVTAIIARAQTDLLSGTSVVAGDELARDVRPTIGETLTRQAGVSATSFGPNASRPVLRGFQGERVRILSDGIGSFDVSNTSVDHPVVINPMTADRIEVLRGPAALLFGSSAIGGVVNVIDSRIPRAVPSEGVHTDAGLTYGSAANERSANARVDVALAERVVAHFDGTYAKSGNLRTGGYLLSDDLRAEAAKSDEAEVRALATLKGELPNSAARTWEVAGGAAFVADGGSLGFSISHYDSLYGIPVRYALDHEEGADAEGHDSHAHEVQLDVVQTRLDVRGELKPESGFVDTLRLRAGYADYQHDELEDGGEIGTSFYHKGWEGRIDLIQREQAGWTGAIGGQALVRKLHIVGEEKYLPRIRAENFGLFTVQSLDLGAWRAEAGGRVERATAKADADVDLGTAQAERRFTAVSGSLGATYEVTPGWRLGVNSSYTQRAPSAEELFPKGPHAGTQAYEIGDPNLAKETSKGLEFTVRGKAQGFSLSASLYHSWFSNYIYELPNGDMEDGLPVFEFQQNKARHYGAEVEASLGLGTFGGFELTADLVGDVSRATIVAPASKLPAPRIPALRLLGGLEAQSEKLDARVETEWVDGQSRLAPFETATPGYTLVNASVAIRPWGKDRPISLILSANNIFDVVARRHASFLKDYAPLAGRDLRATLRFGF